MHVDATTSRITQAFIIVIIFTSLIFVYRQYKPKSPPKVFTPVQRTKTNDCEVNGAFPDRACTPGAVFKNATKEIVCVSGYSKTVRLVSQSTKEAIYKAYGITSREPGEYQVDHFVSLTLGGSNELANLWPEAEKPFPGYNEKNLVTNYLHDLVCNGSLPLNQAQYMISWGWVDTFYSLKPKNPFLELIKTFKLGT